MRICRICHKTRLNSYNRTTICAPCAERQAARAIRSQQIRILGPIRTVYCPACGEHWEHTPGRAYYKHGGALRYFPLSTKRHLLCPACWLKAESPSSTTTDNCRAPRQAEKLQQMLQEGTS